MASTTFWGALADNGLEAVVSYHPVSLSGRQPLKGAAGSFGSMHEMPGPSARSSNGISVKPAPAFFGLPPALGFFRRIPVWVGRDRRQVVSFGLQFLLDLLDRPIELLVFAFEFLSWIVVDHNVLID